jgi:hypothetical protein
MTPATSAIANPGLTRARVLASVSLSVLGFVVVFLVLTAWPGEPVPLLTGNGNNGGGCYLNFLVNELVVDPVNGTAVIEKYSNKDGPQRRVLPIMWPPGYTARRSGSEVEVLARNGQLMARTGTTYRIQGGYEGNVWLTCGMTPIPDWTPKPAQ